MRSSARAARQIRFRIARLREDERPRAGDARHQVRVVGGRRSSVEQRGGFGEPPLVGQLAPARIQFVCRGVHPFSMP
jgi:hypothetical protein